MKKMNLRAANKVPIEDAIVDKRWQFRVSAYIRAAEEFNSGQNLNKYRDSLAKACKERVKATLEPALQFLVAWTANAPGEDVVQEWENDNIVANLMKGGLVSEDETLKPLTQEILLNALGCGTTEMNFDKWMDKLRPHVTDRRRGHLFVLFIAEALCQYGPNVVPRNPVLQFARECLGSSNNAVAAAGVSIIAQLFKYFPDWTRSQVGEMELQRKSMELVQAAFAENEGVTIPPSRYPRGMAAPLDPVVNGGPSAMSVAVSGPVSEEQKDLEYPMSTTPIEFDRTSVMSQQLLAAAAAATPQRRFSARTAAPGAANSFVPAHDTDTLMYFMSVQGNPMLSGALFDAYCGAAPAQNLVLQAAFEEIKLCPPRLQLNALCSLLPRMLPRESQARFDPAECRKLAIGS